MATRSLWKVIYVQGDDLESTLNRLSNEDCKIFSIQYIGSQWVIITEKNQEDDFGKKLMGFGVKY